MDKLTWVLMLSLGVQAGAWAAAIGEPERTARVGAGISYASLGVEDPDGPVESTSGLFPFNIIYTDRLFGSFRYWAEGFYQELTDSDKFEASTTNVGQEMERYGLRFSLQRRLEFVTAFDVWGGAGFFASHDSFTGRHRVDSEGFLLERYPDREGNVLGLQFDLTAEWQLGADWDLAGRLLYGVPFGDGVEEFSGLLGVLYTY